MPTFAARYLVGQAEVDAVDIFPPPDGEAADDGGADAEAADDGAAGAEAVGDGAAGEDAAEDDVAAPADGDAAGEAHPVATAATAAVATRPAAQ
jgi:hypothetical protein